MVLYHTTGYKALHHASTGGCTGRQHPKLSPKGIIESHRQQFQKQILKGICRTLPPGIIHQTATNIGGGRWKGPRKWTSPCALSFTASPSPIPGQMGMA